MHLLFSVKDVLEEVGFIKILIHVTLLEEYRIIATRKNAEVQPQDNQSKWGT